MLNGRIYTWHFTPHNFIVDVWATNHKTICRFEITLSLLHNKRALIERCKQQIEKKEKKEKEIDWDGVDE